MRPQAHSHSMERLGVVYPSLSAVQLEARLNSSVEEKAWLTVGIPTVPRKTGADYLTRTLETLLEELPADDTDPLYGRVRVLVMNNRPGNHSVFYAVRLPVLTLHGLLHGACQVQRPLLSGAQHMVSCACAVSCDLRGPPEGRMVP